MTLSVIIPCLDAAEHLDAAIRSVLNQRVPADEIIVADNGSTDASRAIAAAHAPRVRLIDVAEPGAAAARRAAAAVARGDRLMFLDADDLIAPDTLGALAAALDAAPGAIACCPWMRLLWCDGAWHVAPASCPPRAGFRDDLSAWLGGWYHPPAALLWSRTAYARAGGWDRELTVNDDGALVMRALARGVALVRSRGGTGFYRYATSGQSLSGAAATPTGLISRLRALMSVADALDESGRLAAYAAPLAGAVQAIIDDAERVRAPATAAQGRALLESLSSGGPRPAPPLMPARAARSPAPPPAPRPTMPELVSVVIPTFNRAATLPRAIDSVLAQDHRALELLVVDDASTDDTARVIAGYADPRLRLIRQPVNQGVAAARNRGIAEARGRWLAFLDSDDEWLPGKLTRQLAAMADPRIGMVVTGIETVEADGRRSLFHAREAGDLFERLLVRNILHGAPSSALIRREALAMVGGFDTRLPAIEDYDLWLRLTRFWRVAAIAEPLARYWDEDDAVAGEAQRRSRRFAANRTARRMLFERYVHDMRRAGVDHLYLLDSARRELDSPDGRAWRAGLDLLKAVKRRPSALKLYAWLPLALLPRPAQAGLRQLSRSARQALAGPRGGRKAALGR